MRDDQKKRLQAIDFENYILWRNFVFRERRQMALLVIQLVCGLAVKVPRRFRMMETVRCLEIWSSLEVRAVIRFLWAENVSASDIPSQIVEVYSEEAMIRQHVVK
ncbi:hypothetical protein CEXT_317761 [Caerostris extrusa]|uniref:Uncharacterized protein n=1 Tax=Caerostris extrusa TaxID=172846 RepID=A0AAV4MWG6_CAEEX|nr:hypothetical protein CEXT_317761 [Caerostris extrusa]